MPSFARAYNLDEMLALLEQHEGRVPHAYQDSKGYWTIGVGKLIDKRLGGGISDAAIDFLLIESVQGVEHGLDRNLPWWRELSANRQMVIVSMCFQLGWPRFAKFKKTIAALQARDYETAAMEMLDSDWHRRDSPERARELAEMMLAG